MARPAKYHTPAQAPVGTFSESLQRLPISELAYRSRHGDREKIARIIRKGRAETLEEFALLTSPEAGEWLEAMAAISQRLTQRFYGKAIRLFAPLYLSNECVNVCTYCGFSRHNDIPRLTIPVEVAEEQIAKIARQGFRSLLLVAGEHPKYVSNGYVAECIKAGLRHMPSVALELGPMDAADYAPLVQTGAEGLIVYQESYHQATYETMHKAGPKKYYAWRIDTAERGYEAGFRRLGIGALYGLYDWRHETMAVAAHARHLLKNCWKAQVSVSFPRMRPAAGGYQPDPSFIMSDREMVQVICALRMFLPQVGITLSTRESPKLRDGLVKVGVTLMSAGSSTEPGGYANFSEESWTPTEDQPGEQFHIADERPPVEIAAMIRRQGYEAVWKDFDRALVTTDTSS